MSKYTTEVRFICESLSGLGESVGLSSVATVIENCRSKVFDFEYPLFDSEYRSVIETKILKHFYTREIGAETVGLWKLWLDTRLNEVMPYYNQLYKSALIQFDPMADTDLRTSRQVTSDGSRADSTTSITENGGKQVKDYDSSVTDSGTDNRHIAHNTTDTRTTDYGEVDTRVINYDTEDVDDASTTHWRLYSDTPQGGVNGIEGDSDLEDNTFLTNATKDTDKYDNTHTKTGEDTDTLTKSGQDVDTLVRTGSDDDNLTRNLTKSFDGSDTTTTDNKTTGATDTASLFKNTEDYVQSIVGKRGYKSSSKLLMEFRETFLNIDLMVIHELDDLFMNLW